MGKKTEISFLNTLFCLVVIFIHIASEPIAKLTKDSAAYAAVFVPWRLSAFVVQGFIFLSGIKMFLCFDKCESFSYKRFYLSRFRKIVVPYVFCVFLFYVYFVRNGYFGFNLTELAKYILNGMLVSHFYFVIIIVQFYLLRPLWQKMLIYVKPGIALFAALCITILFERFLPPVFYAVFGRDFIYNDRVFTSYMIYWIMGCYAGANYEVFVNGIKNKTAICALVFVILAAFEATLSYLNFSGRKSFGFLDELHILYSISAILFCMCIALKTGEYVMKAGIMRVINRSSYYIYLIHPLIIFIVNDKMAQYGITSVSTAMAIRAAATYCGTIFLCGIYTRIKDILSEGKRG